MKKLFIILLMLTYGLSSTGMTISLHYCCGKLDGVSFSPKESKTCKMGNHSKKSGCCNDKQISAKVISEQEQSTKWIQVNQASLAVPASHPPFILFTENLASSDKLARGAPILRSAVPIFIKNCVFRI